MRTSERRAVEKAIVRKLSHEPTTQTRNRKMLPDTCPPWEHEPPEWELRVGAWRVFYDVNEAAGTVTIRRVLHKGTQTTGEVMR